MKTILIIDDDSQLHEIYQRKFSEEGFKTLRALTGQEGLALVRSKPLDLIILDIMLRGNMNGFDILEQIKRDPEHSQIPVIVLTNLDSEEKVAKTIGAQDYLLKADTSLDELVKRIKLHLCRQGDSNP